MLYLFEKLSIKLSGMYLLKKKKKKMKRKEKTLSGI